jgi:N-methylhydantoinase B
MEGGTAGHPGEFVFNPGKSDERKLPAAAGEVALPRGSVLRVATPGGGGYGAPESRDAAAVERDRREGRT